MRETPEDWLLWMKLKMRGLAAAGWANTYQTPVLQRLIARTRSRVEERFANRDIRL